MRTHNAEFRHIFRRPSDRVGGLHGTGGTGKGWHCNVLLNRKQVIALLIAGGGSQPSTSSTNAFTAVDTSVSSETGIVQVPLGVLDMILNAAMRGGFSGEGPGLRNPGSEGALRGPGQRIPVRQARTVPRLTVRARATIMGRSGIDALQAPESAKCAPGRGYVGVFFNGNRAKIPAGCIPSSGGARRRVSQLLARAENGPYKGKS